MSGGARLPLLLCWTNCTEICSCLLAEPAEGKRGVGGVVMTVMAGVCLKAHTGRV